LETFDTIFKLVKTYARKYEVQVHALLQSLLLQITRNTASSIASLHLWLLLAILVVLWPKQAIFYGSLQLYLDCSTSWIAKSVTFGKTEALDKVVDVSGGSCNRKQQALVSR